jgi:hypothetical protein
MNYGNDVLEVIQSEFQADSTMAGAIVHNDAEMVLTADSDLAALVGNKCVGIKKFTFVDRSKNKLVKDLEIFSADMATIRVLVDRFCIDYSTVAPAKYPVFDDVTDMKVRALIAVAIGCDVHLTGVPGVTGKVVYEMLMKFKGQNKPLDEYFDSMMESFLKRYCTYQRKKNTIGS